MSKETTSIVNEAVAVGIDWALKYFDSLPYEEAFKLAEAEIDRLRGGGNDTREQS